MVFFFRSRHRLRISLFTALLDELGLLSKDAGGEGIFLLQFTPVTNGKAHFDGLEDGKYELIEVVAPEGYNLLTDSTEVTVPGKDDQDNLVLTVTAEVENKSGSELPSTGGIGTTIFYVLGGLMVIGAAVILVSKKRMLQ